MKNITQVFVAAAVVFALMSSPALAAEGERFYVGLDVGYIQHLDSDLAGIKLNTDGGFLVGGVLGVEINKYFSLEFGVSWAKENLNFDYYGTAWKLGTYTQLPMSLSGKIHIPMESSFRPFVKLGLDYYTNKLEVEDFNILATAPFNSYKTGTMDSSMGFHAGLGVEWFFSENMGAGLSGNYNFNRPRFIFRGPFIQDEESTKFDSFSGLLSLNYYF